MEMPGLCAIMVAALIQTPSFSGTWTLVEHNNKPVGSNPIVAVVTQTDRTMEIKIGDRAVVVALGGAEQTIQNPGPSGTVDVTARARVAGRQFVMEQRSAANSIVQTATLSDDGNEMTIETVAQTPQGEHRETQRFKKS